MSVVAKSFLIRRRVDHWALALASAAMPLRLAAGPALLFLFSCVGVYLAAARHGAARLFAGRFYLFILLYAAWSLGLMAWRGEPVADNRQIAYTLLIALFAFAGPGMVLVRDPLRAYVLGARAGVTLALVTVLFLPVGPDGRVGLGNEAVFAFVVGVSAVSAAIPLHGRSPRFLPDGPHWLALGLWAVFYTETRAVMVTLALVLAVEIALYLRRFSLRRQGAAYAALAVALAALVTVGPVGGVLQHRFVAMIAYYAGDRTVQWDAKISADARKVMWRNAAAIVAAHPVAGVGGYAKMDMVRAAAGPDAAILADERHVHNAVLDELLNDGIVGLVFLATAFAALFVHLWRHAGQRRALIWFALLSGGYGMLHNPLLHETTIASILFFLGVFNAAASRRIMAARRAHLHSNQRGLAQ